MSSGRSGLRGLSFEISHARLWRVSWKRLWFETSATRDDVIISGVLGGGEGKGGGSIVRKCHSRN